MARQEMIYALDYVIDGIDQQIKFARDYPAIRQELYKIRDHVERCRDRLRWKETN
jgi:hypothetical protein